MKIVITGGTGFLGKNLSQYFLSLGHEVIVISRNHATFNWSSASLQAALQNSDAVINLAGRSINCRHTKANKEQILSSRIVSTQAIGRALQQLSEPPKVWINASAIAIYPPAFDKFYDENSSTPTSNFLSHVVQQWEDSFFSFAHLGIRQVALRTGVVLGRNEGAFKPLALLTKFGLGGKIATGKQLVSWLHVLDYCRIVEFTIHNSQLNGIVNCVSPQPLSNEELMQAFRKKAHMPIGMPAPAFAVKIGTFLLGTEASLVLDSIGVLPIKLKNADFDFKYPHIHDALNQLYSK
jgi:uncharacterized protein (TIGR01777 family)